MRCDNHPKRTALGLFRIPYLGAAFFFCLVCRNGAKRDFGHVEEVPVAFLEAE